MKNNWPLKKKIGSRDVFPCGKKLKKNYGNEIDGETFFFEKCIVEKKRNVLDDILFLITNETL